MHKNIERKFYNQKYTRELLQWLRGKSNCWNICIALHVPNAMRFYYKGYTADWLSKELTKYFRAVDRRIYKAGHKNRDLRLPRIVVLEEGELVGWHAHILCDCGEGLNEDETISILKKMWAKHTNKFHTGKFEQRLGYFEYDQGNYLKYILKEISDDEQGTKGLLDVKNIFFPKQ